MEDLKMTVTTEVIIYPEEYANKYLNYLKECEEEVNKEEEADNPDLLEVWLENELADDYDFSLWDSNIENFDQILKEVEKYFKKLSENS